MTEAAVSPIGFGESDFRQLERLRELERERYALQKMAQCAPPLNRAAILVETRWLELPKKRREMFIDLCESVDRDFFELPKRPRNAGEFFHAALEVIWISLNKPQVLRFVIALVRFQTSVRTAMAADQRRRKAAWADAAESPEFYTGLERTRADIAAGRVRTFSREEFLQRFN